MICYFHFYSQEKEKKTQKKERTDQERTFAADRIRRHMSEKQSDRSVSATNRSVSSDQGSKLVTPSDPSVQLPTIALSRNFLQMLNLDDAAFYALRPVFCTRCERLTSTNRFVDRAIIVTQDGDLIMFDLDGSKHITHRFKLGGSRSKKAHVGVSIERSADSTSRQCVRLLSLPLDKKRAMDAAAAEQDKEEENEEEEEEVIQKPKKKYAQDADDDEVEEEEPPQRRRKNEDDDDEESEADKKKKEAEAAAKRKKEEEEKKKAAGGAVDPTQAKTGDNFDLTFRFHCLRAPIALQFVTVIRHFLHQLPLENSFSVHTVDPESITDDVKRERSIPKLVKATIATFSRKKFVDEKSRTNIDEEGMRRLQKAMKKGEVPEVPEPVEAPRARHGRHENPFAHGVTPEAIREHEELMEQQRLRKLASQRSVKKPDPEPPIYVPASLDPECKGEDGVSKYRRRPARKHIPSIEPPAEEEGGGGGEGGNAKDKKKQGEEEKQEKKRKKKEEAERLEQKRKQEKEARKKAKEEAARRQEELEELYQSVKARLAGKDVLSDQRRDDGGAATATSRAGADASDTNSVNATVASTGGIQAASPSSPATDVIINSGKPKLEKFKVGARPMWVLKAPDEEEHFAMMSFHFFRRAVTQRGGGGDADKVVSVAVNSSGHVYLLGANDFQGKGFPMTDVRQADLRVTSRHTVNLLALGEVKLMMKQGNAFNLSFDHDSAKTMHTEDQAVTSLPYLAEVIKNHNPNCVVNMSFPEDEIKARKVGSGLSYNNNTARSAAVDDSDDDGSGIPMSARMASNLAATSAAHAASSLAGHRYNDLGKGHRNGIEGDGDDDDFMGKKWALPTGSSVVPRGASQSSIFYADHGTSMSARDRVNSLAASNRLLHGSFGIALTSGQRQQQEGPLAAAPEQPGYGSRSNLRSPAPQAPPVPSLVSNQQRSRQLAILIFNICRDRLDAMERVRLQEVGHKVVQMPSPVSRAATFSYLGASPIPTSGPPRLPGSLLI